ncbi:hypothetical protein [Mitsuaria sp. 7]|uniref:hypothetical protein n=1 Tax=Mitsuaria sp. 7 TaxID=1658665 RepID=UPI0007DD3A80|nr:hypothetical protein [Mitsuaria sp. 7]ANH66816.1 hypothetical protein ABE85_03175 [Mitsuaria sp. 7]
MAFAEVEFDLEMEPEADWLDERVTEPETASAHSLSPGNPSTAAELESLEDRPGLARLIRMLRAPEEFFGTPSERKARDRGEVVDWASAPHEIGDFLDYWGTRCSDVLFHLHLGAEVLLKNGVRICAGEMAILFLYEEDTMDIFIELSVDANWKQASDLTRELDRVATQLGVPYHGFCFKFVQGAGDEETDERFDWDHDLD